MWGQGKQKDNSPNLKKKKQFTWKYNKGKEEKHGALEWMNEKMMAADLKQCGSQEPFSRTACF